MGTAPARRAAHALGWRASAAVRVLPDFLVIGAQKAGTTSLHDHLCAAADVLPPRKKEVRFFDRHWDRGTLWYRWSFPTRAAVQAGRRSLGRRPLTGEATPDYLLHPLAPARAASVVPGCRLVVLLRDPVDRAHSQYRMNLSLGVEDRPFLDAVHDELARLEARSPTDTTWDDERNFRSYVERSRYHPQLTRWLAHFPRSSMHVTTLEAVLADPDEELDRIARFLGIEGRGSGFVHSNRRDYGALPPEVRAQLFDLFVDDLAQTEELLGAPLGYTRLGDAPRP